MPEVGKNGKRFPYTPAGQTAARNYAVRTGQPMQNRGNSYGNNPGYGGPVVNGPARRPMYGQNPGQGYNMRPNMPRRPLRGYGQRQPMGYGGRPQPGGHRPNIASMLRSLGRRRIV